MVCHYIDDSLPSLQPQQPLTGSSSPEHVIGKVGSESNESETDSATDLCFAVLLYFKLSLLVFTGGYTTCIMFCTNPLACNFICVHILIIIIGKIEMHTLVAWPTSYSFR